jgi:type II secretory pathway component PulL
MAWKKKHDVESLGSNPRNHAHPLSQSRPYWKRAHRDWRVWFVAILLLALMLVYVMTDSLALTPGRGGESMPETNAP